LQGVTSSHIGKDKDEWKMPLPLPASLHAPRSAIGEPEDKRTERLQAARELEKARQLADAGRLKDAAEICERYLGTDSDSAQGWYLLGLIRDASGDLTAVDCYRKALYLKPDHYETLAQMALWSQKNGDSARARTFKARAERAKLQGVNSKAESGKARYA
jgi:chemotaxis protein methyltransferase WspC